MDNRLCHRKGFTLIELVVVIVILGILAAIAVVGYGSLTTRANRSKVENAARTFDSGYRALLAWPDHGSEATLVAETQAEFSSPGVALSYTSGSGEVRFDEESGSIQRVRSRRRSHHLQHHTRSGRRRNGLRPQHAHRDC